jgi:hypothetical protein
MPKYCRQEGIFIFVTAFISDRLRSSRVERRAFNHEPTWLYRLRAHATVIGIFPGHDNSATTHNHIYCVMKKSIFETQLRVSQFAIFASEIMQGNINSGKLQLHFYDANTNVSFDC